jgi:hypothetical protein
MGYGVSTSAVSTAATAVQVDGWQLEKGTSATTFTVPNKWYPVYSGFVERWPSSWALDNSYGVVSPTAVDALALLSQRQLADPLTEELKAHNPRFLYKLNDPEGSTAFADSTGNRVPLPVGKSKYGAGTVTAGVAITSASPTGAFVGDGTVVTLGANRTTSAGSFLDLTQTGTIGPAATTFTRVIAFRLTGTLDANENALWVALDAHNGAIPDSELRMFVDHLGAPSVTMANFFNAGESLSLPMNVADGNWHLMMVGLDPSGTGRLFLACDDQYAASSTDASTGQGAATFPRDLVTDTVGAFRYTTGGVQSQWNGSIAYVGEMADALTQTDCLNLYNAWRTAGGGESTDARYARILRYAGYTGATALDAGQTRSMGPATFAGQDALSALESVVQTETGEHYVDAAGTITFRSRAARYNTISPAYTFGENTAGGEFPYEAVALDFDPTHLANLVTVTQASTGQTFVGSDRTSQIAYFPRTMARTVDSTSGLECQDAASYFLSRYRNPQSRVSGLKLHPSAYPALWLVCLTLELGTRIRIIRRPFGAPPIIVDAIVEQIQWDLDDGNEAFVTLQCSPVDSTPYAVFDASNSTFDAVAFAY